MNTKPDFNSYRAEDDSWINLDDHPIQEMEGVEWIPFNRDTYVFERGRWRSLIDDNVPGENWAESYFDGYANNVSKELIGGSGGATPHVLDVGGMTTHDGDGVFPRYIQFNSGNGYMRWNSPTKKEIYARVYINPSIGEYGYNRNLFRFLDRDGEEVGAFALYMGSVSNQSAENRFVLYNRGSVVEVESGYAGTSPGDIKANGWTRIEFLLAPGFCFRVRVYSDDIHDTIPTKAYDFDVSHLDFSGIRYIDFSESARTFPGNRQPLRLSNLAFSYDKWPGPAERNHIRLIDHQTNLIDSNSTSCPMAKSTVSAGSYVVVAVTYTDAHSTTSIPKITPPSGFNLLGFEAVMNTGNNIRTFLYVYGRYFTNNDTDTKVFTVGDGRTGRWMTNERHYVNVNPENPIGEAWQGETNSLRGKGMINIYPPRFDHPMDGDVALSYIISKVDESNSGISSGQVNTIKSNPGLINGPGSRSYREVTPGRKSMMCSADQRLYGYEAHPVVGFRLERPMSTTSGYGRLSLRNANNPATGPFQPYVLPTRLDDLYIPPPPEPEYETRVGTWYGTWQASWYSFGKRDGTNLYQGRIDSTTGYQCAQVGFDDDDIRNTLRDATINRVEVYLKNLHFYSAAGGEAVIGTHDNSTEPANPASGEKWNRYRANFNYGQGKWMTVNNSFGTDFKSGAARGLTLGRPSAGTQAEYGYFAGSGSDRPRIRITYTVRVS